MVAPETNIEISKIKPTIRQTNADSSGPTQLESNRAIAINGKLVRFAPNKTS